MVSRLGTPQGRVVCAAFASSLGTGLFMASSIAYFTRQVHLTAGQVGISLTVAGAVALVTTLAGGELADRFGPRRTLVALLAWRAVAYGGYALASNYPQVMLVMLAATAADRASPAVQQSLVGSVAASEAERTRLLAVTNVVRNVALSLGAVLAGIALAINTRIAYQVLMVLTGTVIALAAILVAGVSADLPGRARSKVEPVRSLPDRRYLVLTALNFLLLFDDSLLLVAMPVWVLDRTNAPPVTISVLFALNTVLVVLFQMPVSRRAASVRDAGRLQVLAGAALAASCGCFTMSGLVRGWQPVGWLLLAIVVLTFGEVMNNAGGWLLSLSLAPPSQRGRYLAVFNLGLAAERVAGPILVTDVLLRWSDVGWAASAGAFVFAGLMSERVVTRAQPVTPAARPSPVGKAPGHLGDVSAEQ